MMFAGWNDDFGEQQRTLLNSISCVRRREAINASSSAIVIRMQ
jgi:hypothetical protein